jgi:HD superfamily phosphodiesterase
MQQHCVTFEEVQKNEAINIYIHRADMTLKTIGYTEHSFAHVTRTASLAAEILRALGYDDRTVELAQIAGYMHDIGM